MLRNTGGMGILALCIYTGSDTKLVRNQGTLKYKSSNTERTLNKIYIIQSITVITLAIIFGLIGWGFLTRNKDKMPYLFEGIKEIEERPIVIILTFFLLFVRYLPLDVVMLSETGKMIYSNFMQWDARMMSVDKETGEII